MTLQIRSIFDRVLKTERSLSVTTKIGCVNNCSYCPQAVFIKAYRQRSDITMMSFDMFKTCIDKVPQRIIICFAGFCEPWLNPECTEMLLYTNRKGNLIRVNTTLIGMTVKDIDAFTKVPFRNFAVHLPDNLGYSKIKVDDHYLEVIEKLACSRIHNLMWKFHKTSDDVNIRPEVLQILKKYQINVRNFGLSDRAGNIMISAEKELIRKSGEIKKCMDFHHNVLFPNGDIGLCHMDWQLKHIIGNLYDNDFESIYKSEGFNDVINGLKDESFDLNCRYCEKSVIK